jgi:hypothetical protein
MNTKIDNSVRRLLHDAHLRYQRDALRPASQTDVNYVSALAASEIRGVTRQLSRRELDMTFDPSWFTGLRPNFWKAYFDTLTFMAK